MSSLADLNRYPLLSPYVHVLKSLVSETENSGVKIDFNVLRQLGKQMKDHDFTFPPIVHYEHPPRVANDIRSFIQYLGILSAMDFGVVYPHERSRFYVDWGGKYYIEGSKAIDACLARACTYHGLPILDAHFLSSCSLEDVQRIFDGGRTIPFLDERKNMLHEIGDVLTRFFGGQFQFLFEAARYHTFERIGYAGIVDMLVALFPYTFSDFSTLTTPNSHTLIPFHKRAQLFVTLYQRQALSGKLLLRLIDDTDRIACIADYRIPQALYHLGCIIYADDLLRWIRHEKPIPRDHPFETEIRVVSTLAFCALLQQINAHRPSDKKILPCHLDYHLYSLARENNVPHHWTATTAY